MLWPLIAPFKITCVLMTLVVIAATFYARFLGKYAEQRLGRSSLIAVVLFIPAWIEIAIVTEPFSLASFITLDTIK